MLRRRVLPPLRDEHPNVVPLIDVMLCVIVFYMLVARIGVATGFDEDVVPPVSTLGQDLRQLSPTNTLIVNVGRDRDATGQAQGELRIRAQVDGRSGEATELSAGKVGPGRPSLAVELRKLRHGRDLRPNTPDDNPELKVVIRGDAEELTYREFYPVLAAVTEAGVTNVYHNTREPN